MEVVIYMPDEIYDVVCECEKNLERYCMDVTGGTPLPKGHGRLIDADALRKSFQESIDECHKWTENVKEGEMYARVSQALGTFVECSLRTKNAPTIIKADEDEE